MSRSARPLTLAANRPLPISQSAWLAVWPLRYCYRQRAEHVGQRLVQRPALPAIGQPVAGQTVLALVAENLDAAGERLEQLGVAVAEHHLGAVPESVLIVEAVMHGAGHGQGLSSGELEIGNRGGLARGCLLDPFVGRQRRLRPAPH